MSGRSSIVARRDSPRSPSGRAVRSVENDLLAQGVADSHLHAAAELTLDHDLLMACPTSPTARKSVTLQSTGLAVDLDLGELHRVGARVGPAEWV